MACPTCGHTMACLADLPHWSQAAYCPRCGTVSVKTFRDDQVIRTEVYAPKLVERCRQFEKLVIEGYSKGPECWNGLGIAESIRPPAPPPTHDLGGEG